MRKQKNAELSLVIKKGRLRCLVHTKHKDDADCKCMTMVIDELERGRFGVKKDTKIWLSPTGCTDY